MTNTSNTTHCLDIHGSTALFGSSLVSICCLVSVLILYCRYRSLRSHLSTLVAHRITCDLVLAVLFIVNLDSVTGFKTAEACYGKSGSLLAFLVQTTFIAGEGWYLSIAIGKENGVTRCIGTVVTVLFGPALLSTKIPPTL
jgi:hypothetical protein